MRLIVAITDLSVAHTILECLPLPPRSPPLAAENEVTLGPVVGQRVRADARGNAVESGPRLRSVARESPAPKRRILSAGLEGPSSAGAGAMGSARPRKGHPAGVGGSAGRGWAGKLEIAPRTGNQHEPLIRHEREPVDRRRSTGSLSCDRGRDTDCAHPTKGLPVARSIASGILKTRSAFSRRNFGQTSSLNGTFGMSWNWRSRVRPAGK